MKLARALPALVCLATACSGTALMARDDVPALRIEPSAADLAELEQTLARLAGVARVTLAADALTQSSTMTLERPEPGDDRSRPATGRTLGGPPPQVRLVTDGRGCFVLYGDERAALETVRCRPEVSP